MKRHNGERRDAEDIGEQPWPANVVRRLIRRILEDGAVMWTDHARDEMEKDELLIPDCVNVLRGGVVHDGEYENGAWRYRVRTQRICVVVELPAAGELVIVTAWRFKR
jgi:hypothetical protein